MDQNPYSPPDAPLSAPSAKPALLPIFVRVWLWIDMGLCSFVALIALGTMAVYLFKTDLNIDKQQFLRELMTNCGITIFGITGNILLLRDKRVGFWFGCGALVCVSIFLVMSLTGFHARLGSINGNEAMMAGAYIGFFGAAIIRVIINLIYAFVIWKAWRVLRPQSRGVVS